MSDDPCATAATEPLIYGRTQWEVWADGEELRHGIDTLRQATDYIAGLSDQWHTIELVEVKRTVTRYGR